MNPASNPNTYGNPSGHQAQYSSNAPTSWSTGLFDCFSDVPNCNSTNSSFNFLPDTLKKCFKNDYELIAYRMKKLSFFFQVVWHVGAPALLSDKLLRSSIRDHLVSLSMNNTFYNKNTRNICLAHFKNRRIIVLIILFNFLHDIILHFLRRIAPLFYYLHCRFQFLINFMNCSLSYNRSIVCTTIVCNGVSMLLFMLLSY